MNCRFKSLLTGRSFIDHNIGSKTDNNNLETDLARVMIDAEKICRVEWTITVPTLYVFLVRFIKATLPDQEMENLAYFYAELGMMHYATVLYCPSMVAASAVYAANCTLNKTTPLWNATLQLHTGFCETQLIHCTKFLVSLHKIAGESKLKAVLRKYSKPELGAVALIEPTKNLSLS